MLTEQVSSTTPSDARRIDNVPVTTSSPITVLERVQECEGEQDIQVPTVPLLTDPEVGVNFTS